MSPRWVSLGVVGLAMAGCRPDPAQGTTASSKPVEARSDNPSKPPAEPTGEYSLEDHRQVFLQELGDNAEIRALADAGVPVESVKWRAGSGLRFMWEPIAWTEASPLDWRSSMVVRVMFESGAAVGAMALVLRDDLPTTEGSALPIEVLLTPPPEAPESEPLRTRIEDVWGVELEPSPSMGASFQGFVVATELKRSAEGFAAPGRGSWTLVRFERPARALLAVDFASGRGEFLPEAKSTDPAAFAQALAGAVR